MNLYRKAQSLKVRLGCKIKINTNKQQGWKKKTTTQICRLTAQKLYIGKMIDTMRI